MEDRGRMAVLNTGAKSQESLGNCGKSAGAARGASLALRVGIRGPRRLGLEIAASRDRAGSTSVLAVERNGFGAKRTMGSGRAGWKPAPRAGASVGYCDRVEPSGRRWFVAVRRGAKSEESLENYGKCGGWS